jgi:addiction module RelE/StbE family toxin
MIRVVWTQPAREDLREIRDFIARDSAHYARAVAAGLVSAVDRLRDAPLLGRVVPELARPNLRELIEGTYRIVYRVTADEVQILAVVHGAREFPTAMRGRHESDT